jgi:hypothetical protein
VIRIIKSDKLTQREERNRAQGLISASSTPERKGPKEERELLLVN